MWLYTKKFVLLSRYLKLNYITQLTAATDSKTFIIKFPKGSQSKAAKSKVSLNITNRILYGPVLKKPDVNREKETKNKKVIKIIKKFSTINICDKSINGVDSSVVNPDCNSSHTNDKPIDTTLFLPFENKSKSNNLNIDGDICSISIFDEGYQNLPSVVNILQATMPEKQKLILEQWERKMKLKLGEEGFLNYKKNLLDCGTMFHECIELYLRRKNVAKEQLVGIEGFWRSIEGILDDISNVRLIESKVVHPILRYKGCIDCLATYKDNIPLLFEFKSSSRPKPTLSSTFDNPLQLAAYIGALNYDSSYNNLSNVTNAVLIVAYSTGLPAHVHYLAKEDCEKYWALWCQRLRKFNELESIT